MEPKRDKKPETERKRMVVQGIQHLSSSFVSPSDTDVQTLHVTKGLATTSTVPKDVDKILTAAEVSTEADKTTSCLEPASEGEADPSQSIPANPQLEIGSQNPHMPHLSSANYRTQGIETPKASRIEQNELRGSNEATTTLQTSEIVVLPEPQIVRVAAQPKKISYFIQRSIIDPSKKPESISTPQDFFNLLNIPRDNSQSEIEPPDTDYFSIGTVKYQNDFPLQFVEKQQNNGQEGGFNYMSLVITGLKAKTQIPLPAEAKASVDCNQLKEQYEKRQSNMKLLEQYWQTVREIPADFTSWTYLLQHCENMGEISLTRSAYNEFLPLFPYCYGYWKRYCDVERKLGNDDRAVAILERGLQAIPLSVELWLALILYCKELGRADEKASQEDYLRSVFERAVAAAGLHFRSDNLWEAYLEWETVNRRLSNVVAIYKRLVGVPTRLHNRHWENLLVLVRDTDPNEFLDAKEYQLLRERVCKALKVNPNEPQETERGMNKRALKRAEQIPTPKSSKPEDKVTTGMKERFIATLLPFREYCQAEVDKRFDFEDKIKRAYYHVKPLEKGQIETWHAYLDFEISQGVHQRIVLLFERCLIACAHYEEFWARYARFMEQHRTRMRAKNQSQVPAAVLVSEPPQTIQVEPSNQVGVVLPSEQSSSFDCGTGDKEVGTTPTVVKKEEPCKVVFAGVTKAAPVLYSTNQSVGTNPSQAGNAANSGTVSTSAVKFFYNETETVRAIYKRACLIHCCLKAQIKLQWALFEEEEGQLQLARELVYQVIYQHPGLLEARVQHVEMERRAGFVDHAKELFEQFMTAADNLDNSTYSWLAIQYARFLFKTLGQPDKALQILRKALKRDKSNVSLYLHVMDICYQRHPVDIKGITAALELGLMSKALDSEQKCELARRKTQVLREFGSIRAYRESVDKLHELENRKRTFTATPNDSGKKTPDQTPTYVICVKCNQQPSTAVPVPPIITAGDTTAPVSHAQLYNANYTDYYQASYQGIDAYNAAQYATQHLSAAYPPPEGIPFPVLTEKATDPNAAQYTAVAPIDAIKSPSSQATKKNPMFQQWEDTQNKEYAKLETQRWETQPNHNVICSGYDEPELKRRRLLGKSVSRKKNFPYLGRFINMNALVDFRKGKFGEEIIERQPPEVSNDKDQAQVLKDSNEKEVAIVSEVVNQTVTVNQLENPKLTEATVARNVPASTKPPVNEFADDSVIDQSEFVMETVMPSRESEARNRVPALLANEVREPEPEQFHPNMPPQTFERNIPPSMQQNPARSRGQFRHFPPHEESRFRFREPSFQRFPTPFRPQVGPRFDPPFGHGAHLRFRPRHETDFRPHPRFRPPPPSFYEEEGYFCPELPLHHPMSYEQEVFHRDPHMHHPRYREEERFFPQDRRCHNPGNFEEFQLGPNQFFDEGRRPAVLAEPWREEGMWGGPEESCWVPPQRHRVMGGPPSPVPGMYDIDVNIPEELQVPIPPPTRLRVPLLPRPSPPPTPGEKPCINVPAWFVEDGGELSLGQGQHGESLLRYFPNFLNEQGQKMVFDGIRKQIKWHQRSSMDGEKWKLQQRLMAWIGPCNYDIGGTVFAQNTQWPSVCLELLHRLIEMTQLGLNSSFLDLYRSGHDYQGWHADNHPALGKSPTVVLVNTGSARVIEFRTRQREDYRFLRFPLLPGSLVVMNGPTQSDWLRGIPKDASVKQECMQLLFRVIYAVLPQEDK